MRRGRGCEEGGRVRGRREGGVEGDRKAVVGTTQFRGKVRHSVENGATESRTKMKKVV